MNWICEHCGRDTSNVDYEYLAGFNHLSCELEAQNKNSKKKVMKIKGWDKINGFTYKGYCIVNPIHNADETRYMADVLDLNLAHKPKWELNLLTPKHKFIAGEDFVISLWDDNRLNTRKAVSKNMISNVNLFRVLVEEMIDELLKHRLISAPTYNSHSLSTNPF